MTGEEINFLMNVFDKIQSLKQSSPNDRNIPALEKIFYKHYGAPLSSAFPKDVSLASLKNDTTVIRERLDIKGDLSIDYSFVTDNKVRVRLMKDNFSMEDIRLDFSIKNELERFYGYCTFAFLQVEQLINLYYYIRFPDFEKLKLFIKSRSPERYTINVSDSESSKNNKIKNAGDLDLKKTLSDLEISQKIFLFENEFFYKPGVFYDSVIDKLRQIRNESFHRCDVLAKDEEHVILEYRNLLNKISSHKKSHSKDIYPKSRAEKEIERKAKLIKFLQAMNYESVHNSVLEVINIIRTV